MGFTPRQIDEMSIWEISQCIDGYNLANGGEPETEAPSFDEHLARVMRLG